MDDLHKLMGELHAQVREQKREDARRAHARGAGRDDHGMNRGAAAIADWQEEWDRCEVARLEEQQLEAA